MAELSLGPGGGLRPLPQHQSYLAMVRAKRLYSGLFLAVMVLLLVSGFQIPKPATPETSCLACTCWAPSRPK